MMLLRNDTTQTVGKNDPDILHHPLIIMIENMTVQNEIT
jgi:hypothetical protein